MKHNWHAATNVWEVAAQIIHASSSIVPQHICCCIWLHHWAHSQLHGVVRVTGRCYHSASPRGKNHAIAGAFTDTTYTHSCQYPSNNNNKSTAYNSRLLPRSKYHSAPFFHQTWYDVIHSLSWTELTKFVSYLITVPKTVNCKTKAEFFGGGDPSNLVNKLATHKVRALGYFLQKSAFSQFVTIQTTDDKRALYVTRPIVAMFRSNNQLKLQHCNQCWKLDHSRNWKFTLVQFREPLRLDQVQFSNSYGSISSVPKWGSSLVRSVRFPSVLAG